MSSRRWPEILLTALLVAAVPACAHDADVARASPEEVRRRLGVTPAEAERIAQYAPLVRDRAEARGLDPALVAGLVWVESRFDPRARSRAGAAGLMQLMPATARELARQLGRPARPMQPEFNVDAGTHYLARMFERFDGDTALALAAYHAGPGNARRYQKARRIPGSIQAYIDRVLAARDSLAPAIDPHGPRHLTRR